ncbi:MAG: hypothetical protein J6O61_14425 [Butyrivibrio sp.]|uniref:CFI-box-CTERM domain-containing protein n=1 Tax=Butyrivibrio sp. TaxID=28121 RepID=UPI001B1FC6FF|nr:CFI-box-CTERM domain-containing protein [Butyrivibrio sp.]MBO6241997.1 hypothetical protein [Butyrivibrio sp.]
MIQREFNDVNSISGPDIMSGSSRVATELANWSIALGGGSLDSIVVSYNKTPVDILQHISSLNNVIVSENGEIGTTANQGKTYKIGEYKLIASSEHCFNAVVCCFESGDHYNLNSDNDCGVYNAAWEVSNAIKRLDENDGIKSVKYFADNSVGFPHISFGNAPIAQQVYDSEFWDSGGQTTTTVAPGWFASSDAQNSNTNSSSGGCYIATAVYGSYDCPEVWTLRRYRDYTLAEHWYGRAFIRLYYAVSPLIVRMFGSYTLFNKIWRKKLDPFVERLQKSGYESTPYSDMKIK